MKSIVVVGAQWGDEGKGKVVDYMAASFDYIARCAGGHNAGHTVIYNGNRFVLQLIPCGILRPGKHAVIGAGVVVDPAALVAELDSLRPDGHRRARQVAPQQPRAPDLSLSSPDGKSGGSGARRGQNWHHFARHRPRLRRQDVAFRAARLRFDGAGAIPRETRASGAGKRRHLPCGLWSRPRGRRPCGQVSRICGAAAAACRGRLGADQSSSRRRAFGAFRGRAGHHAGHRLRHLSVRDLLERHGGRRLHRPGRGARRASPALPALPRPIPRAWAAAHFPRRCPISTPAKCAIAAKSTAPSPAVRGAADGSICPCCAMRIMLNGITSLIVTKLDVFDTQREIQVCVGYCYKGAPINEMPAASRGFRSHSPGISHAARLASLH